MKVLFEGQVPKDLMYRDAIEDAYKLALDDGRIAVSDGASESFDSKTWANLLAERFVQHPKLSQRWLYDAISDYLSGFDQPKMSWSKQAAFERGSFATLLGIEQCNKFGPVNVLGVGDSIAVLLNGDNFVDSFPYKCAAKFQQRPELFCTKATLNNFFSSSNFLSQHRRTWFINYITEPVILCMTDALGEWALRNEQERHPVWQAIAEIKDASELEEIVVRERQAGKMRIDDTTLVRLSFDTGDGNELSKS